MNKINTFLTTIALVLSLMTKVAAQQYQNEGKACRHQFANRTARIEYGVCTPEPYIY